MTAAYQKKETLLSVKNVGIKLGGKQIIRDINFEVKDIIRPECITGQIEAVLGVSGCGKTTLFSLLAGLVKPDTGTILVPPTVPPYVLNSLVPVKAGDMGVVYQNYFLYPWRKVRTILEFAADNNQNLDRKQVKEYIEGIATDFNFFEHLDKYPCQLSGGQQQRVAIAEQILCGSEFILLDEPFSGLDMIMIDKVVNILVKASCIDEKKTLIIVSHDIVNTVAIADTVYVMAKQPNVEGSTIVKELDLIERGLAWHPDVKEMPEFRETLKEIKSLL